MAAPEAADFAFHTTLLVRPVDAGSAEVVSTARENLTVNLDPPVRERVFRDWCRQQ
jgi:hypothetical protein